MLEHAQDNPLLHAVVSATHGADTELLPLLTTHAESLLVAAKGVIADRLAPYGLTVSADELEAAIDVVVRVVLSHVMQPDRRRRSETAESLAWIAVARPALTPRRSSVRRRALAQPSRLTPVGPARCRGA